VKAICSERHCELAGVIQNFKNRFPLVGETTMVVLVEGSLDNYETS
jgi:hypothetical protein